MKKLTCLLISILIVMSSVCICATATSASNNTYTYKIENVTYTIEFEDNNLAPDKQSIVAEKLIGLDAGEVQTYGLGCVLFGHDYQYTTASVVQHKAATYAPRCKKQSYDVKYCEDCDYTEQTLKAVNYINCCPED